MRPIIDSWRKLVEKYTEDLEVSSAFCAGTVAEWLAGYSGLQIERLWFRVLAGVVALNLTPTVLLSNQVHK